MPPTPTTAEEDAMALSKLPLSFDRSTLKFRGNLNTLGNFLDELATLMIGKTLNDHQKKIYTVRNVEYPNSESWKSIPEFSDKAVSYESYLTKIWSLYPGAKVSQISPEQLHTIVCIKQSLSGVDGMEDFAAYHRQFIVKSDPLVCQQHLLVHEVASLFMSGFSQ
jgi:hypothetical protein